ncbi:MAG: hypothetical protein AAF670_05950, partial [Planctomycetota bacterium]
IDLATDPSEQNDLSDRHPEKVEELSVAFDTWIETMPDPIKGGPKRKDLTQPSTIVSATSPNLTPREIERARIREEKRAAKKAEREQKKTPEMTK